MVHLQSPLREDAGEWYAEESHRELCHRCRELTEAEERIIEEMSAYISGEFEVKDISLAPFGEIFFDEKPSADRYYKAKLAFITIDEKSGNEKRQNVTYLVHAENFNAVVKNVDEVIRGTMIDCEIVSIAETQIMDVFEYHPKETEKANGKH